MRIYNEYMKKVIEVKKLVKKYGSLTAVNNVSFFVNQGEVFGLLGENGAGKTTTLEMIEGLRKPNQGNIKVLGFDVKHDLDKIKEKIGIQLQSSAYYHYLTLKEVLDLFSNFYKKHIPSAELLKLVGLEDKQKSYVNDLSGGQRQRFSIVASLINDPDIAFLDEPTTGLDPISRRHLWDIITEIKKQGKTIILTTHYMEEAEILCDRVAIMDMGKIIAMDDTHKLIRRAKNPFKINFVDPKIKEKNILELKKLGQLNIVAEKKYDFELHLKTQDNLRKAVTLINKGNPEVMTIGRASLEDVFIELTGKNIAKENNA